MVGRKYNKKHIFGKISYCLTFCNSGGCVWKVKRNLTAYQISTQHFLTVKLHGFTCWSICTRYEYWQKCFSSIVCLQCCFVWASWNALNHQKCSYGHSFSNIVGNVSKGYRRYMYI